MDALLPVLLGLGFALLLLLLVLGLPLYMVLAGFARRKRTARSLEEREPRLTQLVCTNVEAADHTGPTALVLGNVAYAADAPSRLASQWRTVFGGSMASLTMQADMARRLAVVRMLEDARRRGAVGVANVRVETSEVFSGGRNDQRMVLELLAYGTALLPAPTTQSASPA